MAAEMTDFYRISQIICQERFPNVELSPVFSLFAGRIMYEASVSGLCGI